MTKPQLAFNTGGSALHLGGSIGRARRQPGGRAVLASVLFHALGVAAFWASGLHFTSDVPEFETYRIELVSPPPQVQGEPETVVPTQPVITEPEPEVVEVPKPEPEPVARTQSAVQQEIPKKVEPKPAAGAKPEPVEVGGEGANVRIEGQEFPYPEYLENIVLQLPRYLRWTGPENLETTVVFYITRTGGVGGLRLDDGSGNFNFDLEAMGAVEQAGRRAAFGPLPEGWQGDRLWVRFTFLPPG